MQCKKGIKLQDGRVPCGQCMHCRVNAGRAWTSRILMETCTHPGTAWFLTLTYDDDHVPRTIDGIQTLDKKGSRIWIQNAMRDLGAFRYFLVGEYGDITLRPHLHLAVFPQSDSQVSALTRRWDKGHSSAYPLTPERAAYLAQYAAKKLTKDTDERLEPGQEPEFRTSSTRPPLAHAFVSVLVHAYSQGAGKALVEERGDVERSWRIGRRILPVPSYVLRETRRALGIPELHRDRLAHPGYYANRAAEEAATWEPTIATIEEEQMNAKKKANQLRYTTTNV